MIDLSEGTRGTVEGTLHEVKWRDERDGRFVGSLDLGDGRHLTVVGVLAEAQVGDALALAGEVERDERFGLQFRIEGTVNPIADAEAAVGYLGSGLVPFVGPATAQLIVDALGAQTISLIAQDPGVLEGFRGLTPARMPAVRRAIRATIHLAPIVGLLDPHGVSLAIAKRVWRRYKNAAPELIRANPWRLAHEIRGVGFKTADEIARGLGCALDDPKRIEAAALQGLRDAASEEGHIVLTEEMLIARAAAMAGADPAVVGDAIMRLKASGEVLTCTKPEGVALPWLAAAEAQIANKIRTISSFVDATPISVSDTELDDIAAAEGLTFDASQRQAAKGALQEHVTVITGSPGTGKTTIVRAILDLAQRRKMTVALVSPTGRAAKRMSELTGREAFTIHRWLGYHPDTGWAGPAEMPDLLVVDEASMLDSLLAARLISVLPPYVRLLFVGDIDQLPAVGPGNVLGDLIASPLVNVFRLLTIHRTEKGSGVPVLAEAIRSGVRKPNFDGSSTRFIARGLPDPDDPDSTDEITPWITNALARHAATADEIQVLAPGQVGPAGVMALNKAIQAVLNPAQPGVPTIKRDRYELRPGDRILVTGNDYDTGLYNGDILYLRAVNSDGSLTIEIDGATRNIPADAGVGLSLAYAMTVHKAQGSEFPVVIIPLHHRMQAAFMLFERRLLYTAVARARRTVVIVGSERAISWAVGRFEPLGRRTLLRGYLGEEETPAGLLDLASDDEDLF